jgi:hypothetical protein
MRRSKFDIALIYIEVYSGLVEYTSIGAKGVLEL